MTIIYNSGYALLAGVTQDCLNYISNATVPDGKGGVLVLKNKNGTPNKKLCMHLLGFDLRFQDSGEVVLSEEKEVAHRIPQVLVRHATKLAHVQEVKLYAGKRKADFLPLECLEEWFKNISFTGDIMHVVVSNKQAFSIEEYGNSY